MILHNPRSRGSVVCIGSCRMSTSSSRIVHEGLEDHSPSEEEPAADGIYCKAQLVGAWTLLCGAFLGLS